MDLPGWQDIYEELGPQGLEIISVAQDTGGEAVAGEWFDRAAATFTQIVDENHLISRLFNMVNVPTGVWIDGARPHCNPVEVNMYIKNHPAAKGLHGAKFVAGCYALAGKIAKAKATIDALPDAQINAREVFRKQ